MTEKRLNQIRQAEAEASPGPWTQTWDLKRGPKIWSEGKPILATIAPLDHCRITEEDPVPQWRKDLTFVRIARSAVPELLAENAALRERLRLNGIQEPETEESK